MDEKIVEVQMADLQIVSQPPAMLVTRGLGSCLGITFYDPVRKMGAMAHAMLPDIEKARKTANKHRFVNSCIQEMVEEFGRQGCPRTRIVAKLFGGAHMFSFINTDSVLNVGQKNIEMALSMLKELGIQVAGQEVGGTFGRTIEFSLETGRVLVKTISWGEKEI
jgi:chemotaxis protein CheD